MRKRSSLVAIAVTIAVTATLIAASASLSAGPSRSVGGARQAAKSLNLWFVDGFGSIPAWQRMEKQFKQEATSLGDKATIVSLQVTDAPTMVSDMDKAIAAHANGILVCDIDPKLQGLVHSEFHC